MIDKEKVLSVITNRKYLIIAIAVLAAIGLSIVGILIYQSIQEFSHANDSTVLSETQVDLIRLEIFKLCFVLFLIAAAGSVGIMMVYKIKLEYIYLVAALCLGTAYMFSITPFSIPDGHHHYQSAYIISGYMLFEDNPYMVDSRHFDYSDTAGHYNIPQSYLRLMDEGIYILRGEAEFIHIPGPHWLDYPLFHFPQALGILIARIIGLSFFGLFYLGRFFNLVFYVLCVTFSIKRLKAFRLPVFLIGLMPMTLHQAASFSYDTLPNAISMLFIAYAISCIYERESFRWRDYVVLLVTGILLAPAKVAYIPIIFLILIVAWKWKEEIKKKAWILAATVIAASVTFALLIFGTRTEEFTGDQLNWEGLPNHDIAFVLENPLETIMIYLRSIRYFREDYFYGIFGEQLSGFSLELPRWYMNIIVLLVFASVIHGKKDQWQPSIKERIIYCCVCGAVVFLILTALFLGWTSQGHIVILGVAGRYFIPILPLALLVLRFKKILVPYITYQNAVILAFLVMQGSVIMYILDHTIDKFLL